MPAKGTRLLFGLLSAWLLLNWIQAGLTELDPDESYYWMYSKELAWGYFDHPPVLACLIHFGYSLFPSEFGLRFFIVLLQPLSFYFAWLLAGKPRERQKIITLIALLAAIPVLHIYGFIATPDAPLLLFTVLFFYAYQRFHERDSFWNAVVLGICMSALIYSKYHGLLIILLTTVSNLRLFRKKYFYLAGFIGVPHCL